MGVQVTEPQSKPAQFEALMKLFEANQKRTELLAKKVDTLQGQLEQSQKASDVEAVRLKQHIRRLDEEVRPINSEHNSASCVLILP